MLSASDAEQLACATNNHRVIITQDREDYAGLHADWLEFGRDHAGIILVARIDRIGPGEVARRVSLMASEDFINRIAYLFDD